MSIVTSEHELDQLGVLDQLGIAEPAEIASTRTFSGRAICTQVLLRDGTQLFVKQDRPHRTESDAAAEAEIVRRLRAAGLRATTPEVIDARPGVAVYRGYQDLPMVSDRTELGEPTARAIGVALAELHGTRADLHPAGPLARPSLDWLTVTPRSLAMHPHAYRELWVRADAAREPLLELARDWRATATIHGDIKGDNIALAADPVRAILFDWETAGLGDPLYDLGCAVGDRVTTWLTQVPLIAGETLSTWLAQSPVPLDSVSADLRTLLAAYGDDVDRVRIVAYAGAYLFQRAMAYAWTAQQLAARGLLAAHLATQFLTRPERTAEILL